MAYISKREETNKGLRIKITYSPPEKRNQPINKRRSHKNLTVKDETEAQEMLKKYQAIEDGQIIDITVKTAVEDWKKYEMQQKIRSKTTLEEYFKLVDYWMLKTNNENKKISEIKMAHILYYFQNIAFKERRDGKDGELSAVRKNYHYSALSTFFQYCVNNNYCDVNYILQLERPRRVYEAVDLPEREVIENYIVCALTALEKENNDELELIFRLVLETGARIGEVRALEWKSVDFTHQIIEIGQSLSNGKDIQPTKNKRIYQLKVSEDLCLRLKAHKEKTKACATFQGHNFVFKVSKTGEPYRGDSMTRKWERFRKRNNLMTFENGLSASFHKFRHYNATVLFEEIYSQTQNADLTLRLVQERLGHASKEITEKVYVHYLPPKDDTIAYEAMSKVLIGIEALREQQEE